MPHRHPERASIKNINRNILWAMATMVFLCDLRTIRLRYLADNELLVMLAALAHSHRMKRMVDLPWSMREDLRLPAISLLTGHGPA